MTEFYEREVGADFTNHGSLLLGEGRELFGGLIFNITRFTLRDLRFDIEWFEFYVLSIAIDLIDYWESNYNNLDNKILLIKIAKHIYIRSFMAFIKKITVETLALFILDSIYLSF